MIALSWLNFTLTTTPFPVTVATACVTPGAVTQSSAIIFRCNASDPIVNQYTAQGNEACVDNSLASNVSIPLLADMNALGSVFIRSNGLPSTAGYFRSVRKPLILDSKCNAVTISNADCGYWHTIQMNETCDTVTEMFGNSCSNLWQGNSFCVQAVGNIDTYFGYPMTSRTAYITLPQSSILTQMSLPTVLQRKNTLFELLCLRYLDDLQVAASSKPGLRQATATARLTASKSSVSAINSANTMTTSKITQSSEATSMAFSSVNTSPDGIRGESTGYSCTNSAAKLATGGLNQGLRLE
ncbi:hypothetical protein M752DRAFT_263282 [Aspergillus phoenicis ATCC 13157]|uniref:LysM domain-containing protein n=2 Tax=Aspergillus TaxID=5052 RepID=A0A370PTZ5_ASPPH|nr:hypothetical protein M747DRAFT_304052 [Aspergillus niger ATCC 13496]RDK45666.1 hypothetical protein M752DRAFT_263282 [Aspergillus phoenicis ATCC 13157]